jgi:hypothetical protein
MKNFLILLVALFSMGLMSMRCTSETEPTSGGGEFHEDLAGTPISMGVSYEVTGTGANKVAKITNTSNEHIKGCITFVNGEGEIISKTPGIIPAGGSMNVPVPLGATDQYVTDEEDCGCDKSRLASVGSAVTALAIPRRARFSQGFCLNPRFSGFSNGEHYISGIPRDPMYTAAFYQNAQSLADSRYKTDFWVDPEVVWMDAVLTDIIVRPNYDLELTIASNIPFQDLFIVVNGIPLMDMSNAYRPAVVGSGWDAWTFTLPASTPEFNYDSASGASWSNEIEFTFIRPGNSSVFHLSRRVTYTTD